MEFTILFTQDNFKLGCKYLCYVAGEIIDLEKFGLLGIGSLKELAVLSSSAPFFHRWENWWQEMDHDLFKIIDPGKEIQEGEFNSGENLGLGHQGRQTQS